VKTLEKSSLDINLTKWLSRCEGSFHYDKNQKTRYDEHGCKTQLIKTKNREQYNEGHKDNEHKKMEGENEGEWKKETYEK